jgi:hypothetical protein
MELPAVGFTDCGRDSALREARIGVLNLAFREDAHFAPFGGLERKRQPSESAADGEGVKSLNGHSAALILPDFANLEKEKALPRLNSP